MNIPYKILSDALHNVATKKLDQEAWFPNSGAYRELVCCNNNRMLGVKYGQTKKKYASAEYCHMLNATMHAEERVICVFPEVNQTETGL